MRLKLNSNDGVLACASVSGQVTQSAFAAEEEPLAQKFGNEIYSRRLMLGLAEAEYLDSRGVGWLLKCHRRFRQAGGMLIVHSIPPNILDVLQVLHMNEVLHLVSDEQSARAKALEHAHG